MQFIEAWRCLGGGLECRNDPQRGMKGLEEDEGQGFCGWKKKTRAITLTSKIGITPSFSGPERSEGEITVQSSRCRRESRTFCSQTNASHPSKDAGEGGEAWPRWQRPDDVEMCALWSPGPPFPSPHQTPSIISMWREEFFLLKMCGPAPAMPVIPLENFSGVHSGAGESVKERK